MSDYVKISSKERIERILLKVCESQLKVFLRISKTSQVAIRSTAINVHFNEEQPRILVSNISANGLELLRSLKNGPPIWVEFIMLSSKIVFESALLSINGNSAFLKVPDYLINIERRQNMRYGISDAYPAYFSNSTIDKAAQSGLSEPNFDLYSQQKNRVILSDISMGGACISSYFPFLKELQASEIIDFHSKLYLPMRSPIELATTIRWQKKVTERFESFGNKDNTSTVYKVGVQFVEDLVSDEVKGKLIQYMARLNQQHAV